MPETLDIAHLRTFVAIAECGGFGRAAAALQLSQPTVSQHVRLLERKLDTILVERVGRVARFTPSGDNLLVQARRIIAVHDDALDALEAGVPQTITIGCAETAGERLLPELVDELRRALTGRPSGELRFRFGESTELTDAVDRGAVDLAVILGLGGDLPGRQLGTLPLGWFAREDLAVGGPDEPVPLVTTIVHTGIRERALQQLGAYGHTAEVIAEAATLEGIAAGARAGLGVAVLPSAGGAPAGLVARRDLPELGSINVRLVSRRGIARDLEDAIVAVLTPYYSSKRRTDGAPKT